jgi:hypothetical protein
MTENQIREITRQEIRTMLQQLAENLESTARYLLESQDSLDNKLGYSIDRVATDCRITRNEIGEEQQ